MTQPTQPERLPQVVKLLTELASLVAFATALLFYFGWVRTDTQARAFGAEVSVFGLSSQDYVLRSLDVVFLPGVLLLLLILAATRVHRRLVAHRRLAARLSVVLQWAWLLPVVVGLPLAVVRPETGSLVFPFWVALAVLGTLYGVRLRREVTGDASARPLSAVVLVVALVAVTMFWTTERVARIGGQARADQIKVDPASELDQVGLFSEKRLFLAGPGVTETALTDPEAAYRYRYDGLYLLQQSGGRYFLLTDGWSDQQGRLVVLPADASIRLEFGAPR